MPLERLQKIIAAAGIASRRKAEELITQGRVAVNGTVVSELGVLRLLLLLEGKESFAGQAQLYERLGQGLLKGGERRVGGLRKQVDARQAPATAPRARAPRRR